MFENEASQAKKVEEAIVEAFSEEEVNQVLSQYFWE